MPGESAETPGKQTSKSSSPFLLPKKEGKKLVEALSSVHRKEKSKAPCRVRKGQVMSVNRYCPQTTYYLRKLVNTTNYALVLLQTWGATVAGAPLSSVGSYRGWSTHVEQEGEGCQGGVAPTGSGCPSSTCCACGTRRTPRHAARATASRLEHARAATDWRRIARR